MSTNEITTKIRRMKRLQAKAEELRAGEFKIRYALITSNRFDSKAFKATYAALYEQFTKQTTSRRFSVA